MSWKTRVFRPNLFILALFATLFTGLFFASSSASALGTVTVSGTVHAANGSGLAGVTVYATEPNSDTVDFGPVTTDSDGNYTLDVTVGTYDFHFDPLSGSNSNPLVDRGEVILNTAVINVNLTPVYHTFSGTLTDMSGNPLADYCFKFVDSICTDSQGHFSSGPKLAQAYSFLMNLHSIHDSLNGIIDTSASDVYDEHYAIDLTDGDVNQTIAIPVPSTSLNVVVKDNSGNPVSATASMSAYVNEIHGLVNGEDHVFTGTTDGSATTSTTTGTTTFAILDGSLIPAGLLCAHISQADVCNTNDIIVNGDTTVNLTLQITTPPVYHTFSGTLTDMSGNPLADYCFKFVDSICTDTQGHFSSGPQLAQVYSGQVLFHSIHDSLLGIVDTSSSTVFDEHYTVDLTDGDVNQTIAIPVPSTSLNVIVKDSSGNPVSANTTLSSYNTALRGTVNGEDHLFTGTTDGSATTSTATGTTSFAILDGLLIPAGLLCAHTGQASVCNTNDITVNGDTTVNLVLQTTPPPVYHTFSGTLTDLSGNPLADYCFKFVDSICTDNEGHFSSGPQVAKSYTNTLVFHSSHDEWLGIQDPSVTDVYTDDTVDLTNGDVEQTIALPAPATTVTVVAKDDSSNPVSAATSLSAEISDVTGKINGDDHIFGASTTGHATTNSTSGATSFTVFDGSLIRAGGMCASINSASTCTSSDITIAGPLTVVFQQGNAFLIPSAPINLSVTTPAQRPSLSWEAQTGASSYNIFRDGSKIASSSTTSYTDNSAADGNHTYTVTAVNAAGESANSNSASALVDNSAPSITYSVSPATNSAGWNKAAVTVTFTCVDNTGGVGVNSCSSPMTVNTEGVQTVTGTTTDKLGNTASVSATVNMDATAPTTTTPAWTSNPVQQGQNTTLSISAADQLSGVSQVTYTIGTGSPQPMTFNSSTNRWTSSFGSGLAAGTYNIVIQATDKAGNVSAGTVDVLAVYTTGNGYVNGHVRTVPTGSDTLPIAKDTSTNPTQLVVGFTNLIAPTTGSFDVDYAIKNNVNEFTLSSKSIAWVIVSDSTHASILGTADLTTYVNGVKTVTANVSVKFDIVIGANGSPDQISMKIYNPGVNPNTGTPAYVVIDTDLANSNITIHP